jgi:purine-binding chemotaxis protein CheW
MATTAKVPVATAGKRDSQGSAQGHQNLLQLVSFHVGGEEFGLDILRVQEIIRVQQLTRVPNSPDFVEGVINLRGKVIPVIALRKRFGLEQAVNDKQTRIVVVEVKGAILGFMVDSVSEVLRIPGETVEPPPRLGKVEREYVSGVGKLDDRLLILLDVDRLMSDSEEKLGALAGGLETKQNINTQKP